MPNRIKPTLEQTDMRTQTILRDVYTFSELDESAQEKALNKMREFTGIDSYWHEWIIDDVKECGKILGIDIDNIYFSGFSSQGDGACFTGTYGYAKQSLAKIKEHTPQDTELHRIGGELQAIQARNFYGISASVKHRGHYSHELCTDINVDDYRCVITSDDIDAIKETLRDFMRWTYRRLESEYEYQNSREALMETIDANQ
jgi:hypothetical protein